MALPAPLHPCWTRLAKGEMSRIKTQQLGMQLLAKRLEKSPAPVNEKAAEIRGYFEKYERILGPEISQLAAI